MPRTIQYAVSRDDGTVWSRVASEIACPVLDFEAIGQGGDGFAKGDFNGPINHHLEKFPVHTVSRGEWACLKWTKKVPVALKNLHRKFWGMKPLPVAPSGPTLF
jgi:hypothetical protein